MYGGGEAVKLKIPGRCKAKAELDLPVAKYRAARQRVGEIDLAVRAWDALALRLDVRQANLHAHQIQRGVLYTADFARKCHYIVLLSLLA